MFYKVRPKSQSTWHLYKQKFCNGVEFKVEQTKNRRQKDEKLVFQKNK